MNSVEKLITANNVERTKTNPEFLKRRERERKLLATNNEVLDVFKPFALPMEQIYLSHPQDEFNLRVRACYTEDGPVYTATLKDKGEVKDGILDRLEVETPINEETYAYYQAQSIYPRIKKLRAEIQPGVTIDYIEGLDTPLVEIESSDPSYTPSAFQLMEPWLRDHTDSHMLQNETMAWTMHQGEALKPTSETLDHFIDRVVGDMVATYSQGHKMVAVGIAGMSGSGKSTAVSAISDKLERLFGADYRPLVLSTDDYHVGRKHLEETHGAPWTNWDSPVVYDTETLSRDLNQLSEGGEIIRRHFDFGLEETVEDGVAQQMPFVIVEGIAAGSPHLKDTLHLRYEVPTSYATSVGRDIRRLVLENRVNDSIGSPEDRLRYQLETALPTYLEQERPKRQGFSACSRPLAERAFMLDRLREL